MINIDRNNYEEYFLLYVDDELSATERKAVEDFINTHPDLKIEMELLQQSTLPADHIVYHQKDSLLRSSSLMINTNNYEEYFVLYADDELSTEEKDSVEQFVYRNPQYQGEFELIQRAKMEPDRHLLFPDKSLLYRTEKEEAKVFVLAWWKVAVAIIVFIFLSGTGWFIISEKNTRQMVNNIPQKKTDTIFHTDTRQPKAEIAVQAEPTTEKVDLASEKAIKKQRTNVKTVVQQVKRESDQIVTNSQPSEKNVEGRNIQLATNVREKHEVNLQKLEQSGSLMLGNNKEIIDQQAGPVDTNEYAHQASNEEIEILNTSISKKNKLRGLFRKVSRVVEKATSIDPGDVKGIRIANFEIAVK